MTQLSEQKPALDFELTDPEVSKCPFPYYAQLHQSGRRASPEPKIGWAVSLV